MLISFSNRCQIIILFLFCSLKTYAQTPIEKCKLSKSYHDNIYTVTTDDVRCLAKNSENPNTIFYTFASWCQPCVYTLPYLFTIELVSKVDVYVVLVDKENSRSNYQSREHIYDLKKNSDLPIDTNILVIKDLDKGGQSKKYKDFLKKITPNKFEIIDDMSKFIVLNRAGEVQLVTSYKDKEDNADWKNPKPMIKRIVLPLLEKRTR